MATSMFRLSNLSIKIRMAILLLPLTLGLGLTAGQIISEQYDRVRAMEKAARLTQYAINISAFVHELQRERGSSGLFIGSKGTLFKAELEAQRGRSDERRPAFEHTAGKIGSGEVGGDLAERTA